VAYAVWEGKTSRKIIARIVIEGELELLTSAHFGNGDTDDLMDMPLLVDSKDERTPLLTGSSIAGALRSYLREREKGYFESEDDCSTGILLFGALKRNESREEGEQSLLIVEDSLGTNYGVELRTGVAIDPKSRTAEHKKLFEMELWRAGTRFPLRFELLIREGDDVKKLKRGLASALEGFNNGSITLGARKRRGFGRVCVNGWRVKEYDLTSPEGLLHWIKNGADPLVNVKTYDDIKEALGVDELIPDNREFFDLDAVFSLEGSLLLDGSGGYPDIPDKVHLRSIQADGTKKPVLPGTSVAGALRARALKIANTISDKKDAQELIDEIFGKASEGETESRSSRIEVWETVIEEGETNLVQFRISIDRFTGGTRESALFNEQPVFGNDKTLIRLRLRLLNPKSYEIGLLLLLLKDLWTGDLSLGGGSSIGRGRLKGKTAEMLLYDGYNRDKWKIYAEGQDLIVNGDKERLENFVRALNMRLKGDSDEIRDKDLSCAG